MRHCQNGAHQDLPLNIGIKKIQSTHFRCTKFRYYIENATQTPIKHVIITTIALHSQFYENFIGKNKTKHLCHPWSYEHIPN